jgi:hypothetical protein
VGSDLGLLMRGALAVVQAHHQGEGAPQAQPVAAGQHPEAGEVRQAGAY